MPYSHKPDCPSRLRISLIPWRAHPRVGIKQVTGEFLEAVRRGRPDAQIAELELGARPRQLERPRDRFRTPVLRDQREQRLA